MRSRPWLAGESRDVVVTRIPAADGYDDPDGIESILTMRVNSWDEWSPLRHVIVGRAEGTMVQAPELAVARHWPEEGFPLGTYGAIPAEMTLAADAQLEHLVTLLEGRGIRVDRPAPLEFDRVVSTPDWSVPSMFGCASPRDVLLTVGPEILEATMSYRSRWFEYLCYRPLIEAYYASDPGMRWEAAPKPRLTDRSYVEGVAEHYASFTDEERARRVQDNDLTLTQVEPLFDAADIVRIGRDLFVQTSSVTNRTGVRWLQDHFPDLRVSAVTFDERVLPIHVDATWVPLRPGLVLHCGERPAEPDLTELFRVNDWEVVSAAAPSRDASTLPPLCYCSQWLSMNVLSLDADTVCVEASEHEQAQQLYELGFEVVPVPFWDVAPFGGGLHCATLDVERDGGCTDYLPRRVGRFR